MARIEMFAVSERETGQFAFARNAASTNSHCATFGTVAITSRCDLCHRPSGEYVLHRNRRRDVDLAGLKPASASSLASVIEKLPA